MKILVTGTAGFIGFHTFLALRLSGHSVIGIDNINSYNDVRLKLARLNESGFDFPYEYVGSALDSYAVRLLTTDKKESKDFLKDEKKRGILFNDALRFSIVFHEMFAKEKPKFGFRLNDILESNIKDLGLVYSEHLVDGINPLSIGSPESKDDLIIVSKDGIPEDDEKWILTETRKVREGEIEILRKYLILKVSMFSGM